LVQKPWKQEITNIPDWPRRKAVAEFQLCVGHDCLGTRLHRTAILPDPYCMLCSLHEPMDKNHLGQSTALSNRTECEQYWEARTKMTENCLRSLSVIIFVTAAYYLDLYIYFYCFSFFFMYFSLFMQYLLCNFNFSFYLSHRAMINNQRACHYKLKKTYFAQDTTDFRKSIRKFVSYVYVNTVHFYCLTLILLAWNIW
jgi:hypothetical protein